MGTQQCRSVDGWVPIRVGSSSQEGLHYTVLVNPWGETESNICQCIGYTHHGHCRHQEEASDRICGWRAVIDGRWTSDQQSDSENISRTCPWCHGPTMIIMEIIDCEQNSSEESYPSTFDMSFQASWLSG